MSEFMKNPFFLAILAGILAYSYLYWEDSHKRQKNPKMKPEQINYLIPITIALLVFIIAYNVFDSGDEGLLLPHPVSQNMSGTVAPQLGAFGPQTILNNGQNDINLVTCGNGVKGGQAFNMNKNVKVLDGISDAAESATFHLIGRNVVKLPQTDVFIDLA